MKSPSIWFCVLVSCLVSSQRTFHGHKLIRTRVESTEHATLIRGIDKRFKPDFWHPFSSRKIRAPMTVDFHTHANHSEVILQLLKQHHMPHEVLFHNLQDAIKAQLDNTRKRKSKKHSYTKYNEWKTIAAWIDQIATKYSHIVQRLEIGKTYEGNPMYVLKIGEPKSPKPAIFMDCGIHAREWVSPAFCQWFVKELVQGYSKDESVQKLLANMDFYILPVLNIDGYIYTWTEDRFWRKNRAPTNEESCFGSDLNRNFNVSWGEIGSSDEPCSEIYCGPSAESEMETKNVASFIRTNKDTIKAYISIHSYSQMMLYPYSYTTDPAPNAEELDNISKGAVTALNSLYGTQYEYGPSATTIYPTSGSSDDWAYEQGIKYSFTFELRDTGKYGFLLPESQIKATGRETTLAIKYIANYILSE